MPFYCWMLNNIVLYRYTMLYLGCVHFLAVMSNTAMSIDVQFFFRGGMLSVFFGCTPTGWFAVWCLLWSYILHHQPLYLIRSSHSGALSTPKPIVLGPHTFAHFAASPKELFLSSFWVQILCVIQGPTQMSLPPLLPPAKVMWPHRTCPLTLVLPIVDWSYSVPRSYYLPRFYISWLQLGSGFWIHFCILSACM